MEKKVAGFIVAPLWHAFMDEALKNRPAEFFTRAEVDTSSFPPVLRGIWQGGQSQLIDSRTGAAASAGTPQQFLSEKIEGGVHSILYWIDKNNPTGSRPSNPANDPQFTRWETPIRAWAQSKGLQDGSSIVVPHEGGFTEGSNPGTPTPSAPAQSSPAFYITNPKSGGTIPNAAPLTVEVAGKDIVSVRYYFNGLYIGTSSGAPYSITLVPSALASRVNDNNIIRAVGSLQNGSEISTEISVVVR